MEKEKIAIVLGTAHLWETAGKRSPDGKLREPVYSREIVAGVKDKLEAYGYRVFIDYEPLEADKQMFHRDQRIMQSRELARRVGAVNSVCRRYGAENTLFVSIHVDASSMGDRWSTANGWSVRVHPSAGAGSRLLADCLYSCAQSHGLKCNRPSEKQTYWEQRLKVLGDTQCAAVLTENLFQDNEQDVRFLLSEEGRHTIERLHVEGIIDYIQKYMP